MAGSQKNKRASFTPLNLSFLDIMSCGLGAVILIFLILKHGESTSPEEVFRVEEDIESTQSSIQKLQNDIETTSSKIESKESEIKKISNTTDNLRTIIKEEIKKRDSLASQNKVIQEALKRLEKEKPDIIEKQEDGERQYLTGLKVEGKRIAFILDSSASMLDKTIVNIVKRSLEDVKVKENSEKWVRAKESLKWLIARLPEESRYTILTFNEKVNSHTRHGWLSGKDPIGVKSALGDALKEIPKGGTNLEKVLEQVMDMRPRPDSVYLITDGLPTKGQPVKGISLDKVKKCFRTGTKSKPIRTITAECRVELFLKALRNYLKERKTKTSIILLPLEGDPFASFSFWSMAQQTNGVLISPSKDWP